MGKLEGKTLPVGVCQQRVKHNMSLKYTLHFMKNKRGSGLENDGTSNQESYSSSFLQSMFLATINLIASAVDKEIELMSL